MIMAAAASESASAMESGTDKRSGLGVTSLLDGQGGADEDSECATLPLTAWAPTTSPPASATAARRGAVLSIALRDETGVHGRLCRSARHA